MPFIPRPSLPTGLASMVAQLQAQRPTPFAQVLNTLSGLVQAHTQRGLSLEQEKRKTQARRDELDFIQSRLDLRARESKVQDTIKNLAEQGLLEMPTEAGAPGGPGATGGPARLPFLAGALPEAFGPVLAAPATTPGGVPLAAIIEAMGGTVTAAQRGLTVRPKAPSETETERLSLAQEKEKRLAAESKARTAEGAKKREEAAAAKVSKEAAAKLRQLLSLRTQTAAELSAAKDPLKGDVKRVPILQRRLQQQEAELQKAGFPGFSADMAQNIERAQKAVSSGRVTREEAVKRLSEGYGVSADIFEAVLGKEK